MRNKLAHSHFQELGRLGYGLWLGLATKSLSPTLDINTVSRWELTLNRKLLV